MRVTENAGTPECGSAKHPDTESVNYRELDVVGNGVGKTSLYKDALVLSRWYTY